MISKILYYGFGFGIESVSQKFFFFLNFLGPLKTFSVLYSQSLSMFINTKNIRISFTNKKQLIDNNYMFFHSLVQAYNIVNIYYRL